MWRAVAPQLFALLAHSEEEVARLAGELLQGLQMLDPAAVLFPALVESKRISSGQSWPIDDFLSAERPCLA